MRRKIISLIISLAMAFTLIGGVAYAGEDNAASTDTYTKAVSKISNQEETFSETAYNGDIDYLKLLKPVSNAIYYKGEKMTFEFNASDTWEEWWSQPCIFISKNSTDKLYKSIIKNPVPLDGESVNYKSSFTIPTSWPTGTYTASVMLAPIDDEGNLPEDYDDVDYEEPFSYATISIKTLCAPTSVKAVAGKGKATITWAKATGAQKYYIYRSTSKTTGFKYIGATTTRTYVDKNKKKGKTYYYKVKSVRTTRNLIKSAYSSRVYAKIK